jgi:hypothetical protein
MWGSFVCCHLLAPPPTKSSSFKWIPWYPGFGIGKPWSDGPVPALLPPFARPMHAASLGEDLRPEPHRSSDPAPSTKQALREMGGAKFEASAEESKMDPVHYADFPPMWHADVCGMWFHDMWLQLLQEPLDYITGLQA